MLGRVIDAKGTPLDTLGEYPAVRALPVDVLAPAALDRTIIDEPLGCGIKAVDAFLTCGRGQRVGIFGGSGVGKSTLIGMMARGTNADLTVLALVGERGREVGEFGNAGRGRPTPFGGHRLNIGSVAAVAYSRGAGSHCGGGVLQRTRKERIAGGRLFDTLCHGTARNWAGGRRTSDCPKVIRPLFLTMLAKLVERAGRFPQGSITAFYNGLDGRRRPTRSYRRYGAIIARWPHCA